MKVDTKIQMEQKLKNEARQRIKDRINEKMEIKIKHFKNKNKTRNDKAITKYHTFHQQTMITFNTTYFIKIIPACIQNISTILK